MEWSEVFTCPHLPPAACTVPIARQLVPRESGNEHLRAGAAAGDARFDGWGNECFALSSGQTNQAGPRSGTFAPISPNLM